MATAVVLPSTTSPLSVITDEEGRWVVIGICLNKLLTPLLKTVLGNEIPAWYNTLCLLPSPIDRQTFKNHARTLPPSTNKLNYGNINNNYANHKSTLKAYDYNVKNPEALAMLFVQPFMAKFTGFDQTMDLSVALTVMCEADPFISSGAAAQARKIRSDVRNEWAHCNFSHWSDVEYHKCIKEIEVLVKKLNLPSADENNVLSELNDWERKGVQLCCGEAVNLELIKNFKAEVCALRESWKEENSDVQSQLMESLGRVQERFCTEIEKIEKDIDEVKVQQQSLSVKCETTSQKLQSLENEVAKLAIENQEIPHLSMLPERIEWFSGRESEIKELRCLLNTEEKIGSNKVQMVSVCGLGGSGKTSLAAEYAHRYKGEYGGGTFWFSAEDEATFNKSVDDHAVVFGTLDASPDRTFRKTLELISKIEKPWLLVLDDMDEYKVGLNIKELLSGPWKRRVGGSGHILITTRRKPKVVSATIRGFKESQCLQLECFSVEDGKLFVLKRTKTSYNDASIAEAISLVETLGRLPLALEQACAYISNLSCSLSSYLQQYKIYSIELLNEEEASPVFQNKSPERLAVRTTWLLNFDHIKKSPNGKFAVRFLHACAFFNPNEIQKELINPGKPLIEDKAYRDYVVTPLGSSHILKLLSDFSLFKKRSSSSLSVHRLVQDVLREKLKSDAEEISSLIDAISMLSLAFAECSSPDDLLTTNDVSENNSRASVLVTDTSRFYCWQKLCIHAQEVFSCLNSFQVLDERILVPETARIVYECSLDYNIRSETDKAKKVLVFARKILQLGSISLSKGNLEVMFPHEVPLPESFRRYIFYSCMGPSDAEQSSTSDIDNRIGLYSQIKVKHVKGNAHFEQGNFQKAIEIYSSILAETNTFDCKLLCDRAMAYLKLHKYSNALVDLEDYLKKRPKCWLGFAAKALTLHGLNKIWEASSFASLAFYYYRDIFEEYEPFKGTFASLKSRIHICNNSSFLTDILSILASSQTSSKNPSKIIVIEPGDYLVNFETNFPAFSDSFAFAAMKTALLRQGLSSGLSIVNSILIGVQDVKTSVVIRFYGKTVPTSMHRVMALNISFVFSEGHWETQPRSTTEMINCSFTSSLEESNFTVFSCGTDSFKGCRFQNCQSPGLTVKGRAIVENCVFSAGEYSGVKVDEGGCLMINGCKLYGNYHGIFKAQTAGTCDIRGCEIFDNKVHGIYVHGKSTDVKVDGCRIFQNDLHGIFIDDDSSSFVSNCEIFENGWQGIAAIENGRCTASHNKIYGNKAGGVQVVPVGLNKGERSIVEFNEIFDNRGPGIETRMMSLECPKHTNAPPTLDSLEKCMYLRRNMEFFKVPRCKGNTCYNNEDHNPSAASNNGEILSDFCFFCRKKCFKCCTKCFVTTYCNKECQKKDWKKHKNECASALENSTIRVDILSKQKGIINPETAYVYPGLEPKSYFSLDFHLPEVGKRFVVKIVAADEVWLRLNVDGPLLSICDHSKKIDGDLDVKRCRKLYNIVLGCGVTSTIAEGWKKKFFWAQLIDEDLSKIIVFTTRFPPYQKW